MRDKPRVERMVRQGMTRKPARTNASEAAASFCVDKCPTNARSHICMLSRAAKVTDTGHATLPHSFSSTRNGLDRHAHHRSG